MLLLKLVQEYLFKYSSRNIFSKILYDNLINLQKILIDINGIIL